MAVDMRNAAAVKGSLLDNTVSPKLRANLAK
jgi:hypothetical protein